MLNNYLHLSYIFINPDCLLWNSTLSNGHSLQINEIMGDVS